MDLKSLLGYANGSPFAGSPYLDIQAPEGLITMQDTPIDLLGIDNLGNIKKMKKGRKNPYKFEGDVVREIPYSRGGMTQKQLFDFIFDDDDEEKPKKADQPTAPTTNDIPTQEDVTQFGMEDDTDQSFISTLLQRKGNPYTPETQILQENVEIRSSGKYGSQGVGQHGRIIYNDLARSLGYAPVANSIYRSEQQQNALIASGAPAVKNSYHLTGNAVDIKPADWYRLTDEQQQYFRNTYDVINHNNHYHIEPKR